MAVLIWVDGWQMQCCGEPFSVGDVVAWHVDDPDSEWLSAALGPEMAQRVAYAEERHSESPDDLPLQRGSVIAIHAAFSEYAPISADSTALYPVKGSAVLREVPRADGSDRLESGATFNGYVVEVEQERSTIPAARTLMSSATPTPPGRGGAPVRP
ncbi:DUF6578 domain-containing protein [Sanguibacter sp. 25GB23B1]|uniref:DUF6578 domain-containing protein n=1 Tax=unclassified Sanguibacter TaxID=2645534 RepID=UPI0032AF6C3A